MDVGVAVLDGVRVVVDRVGARSLLGRDLAHDRRLGVGAVSRRRQDEPPLSLRLRTHTHTTGSTD